MKKTLILLLMLLLSFPFCDSYVFAGIRSKIAKGAGTALILRAMNGGKTGNEDPKTGKTSLGAEKKWVEDQIIDKFLPNFPAMRDAVKNVYGDPEKRAKAIREKYGNPW